MNRYIWPWAILLLSLFGVVVAVWLWPSFGVFHPYRDTRYGLHEGREVVMRTFRDGRSVCLVEDAQGRQVFAMPLRNCYIDSRYRGGELHFRDKATGSDGFLDKQGRVYVAMDKKPRMNRNEVTGASQPINSPAHTATSPSTAEAAEAAVTTSSSVPRMVRMKPLARHDRHSPFAAEANKILQGKLTETDAQRRTIILNYCEHFRAAYPTRDLDFLRQVFSDQALIIVGNECRTKQGDDPLAHASRVSFHLRTKQEYLSRLERAFAANKRIDVTFSDFHIYRHPTMDGIYGVTLRQQYRSDRYADDGYLFLLWDFRNPSMPLIHVRTWQPAGTVRSADDIVSLGDFNLE